MKIYVLSFMHIFRIAVMGLMWVFPILFFFISGYFLINADWINFLKFSVLGIAIHYSYPIVLSWFEEERIKFKKQVDIWSEYQDGLNK
jgi:hypothetical protein